MDQIPSVNEQTKTETKIKFNNIGFYLLSLAVLLLAGYLIKTNADLQQDLLNTKAGLKAVEKNINSLQTGTTSLTIKLAQQQQTISSLQLHSTDKQQGLVAEVAYLVQLANYNLTYMQNIAAAKTLLNTADKRLSDLSESDALKARQQLATIITQLNTLPNIDVAGLLTRLHSLQIQASKLLLLKPVTTQSQNNQQHNQQNNQVVMVNKSNNWREALANTWDAWQKLIVIQHHDKPIEPVLPAQQQLYLQQNLQLILQQAQWAVLHRQAAVYQSSLQQTIEWMQRYFVATSTEAASMINTLIELKKINLQITTPEITPLLQTLQRLSITTQNKGEIA